jgi:hypothetical protein
LPGLLLEANMPDQTVPLRPWRQIAAELAGEMEPKKVVELSHELSRALDEQLLAVNTQQDAMMKRVKNRRAFRKANGDS